MTILAVVCAMVAAVIHVAFFAVESLAFRRQWAWQLLGFRTREDAAAQRTVFFNQGFYNLFLAVGAVVGAVIFAGGGTVALVVFALFAMLGAAVVLVASAPRVWLAALLQGLAPLVGLTAIVLT